MKKIIIYITCLSIILASCGAKHNTETTTNKIVAAENILTITDKQAQSAKISLGTVEQKTMSSIIKINGKIDVPPQNTISISMPLGGYLKTTKLLPGMHINKGEVIATMEDQQYIQLQQEYLTAKSKLVYSEAEYVRQKELNESKASSDKVFQQTQMEYNTQKITIKALSEKLKLININPNTLNENNISKSVNIYAPIDGFVSKVNVNIGKYVNPADILFELVNPTDIHLNLNVFEKDLDKLAIGQKLVAYSNNNPSQKHPCEIILISKDLSPERFAEVHCHFEEYDKTLLPGMYMNAEIEIKSTQAFVISEDAIVSFEGKKYLFAEKKKNTFEMIEVQTGVSENGFIEIKNNSALQNQQIVIKGAYTLLMSIKNKAEEE